MPDFNSLFLRVFQSLVPPALVGLMLLDPGAAKADDEPTEALASEIAALYTWRTDTTSVRFQGCTLHIQRYRKPDCTDPKERTAIDITLDLSEITQFSVSPFREGVVLSIDLDVAQPSRFQTLFNHVVKGKEAAFESYAKEMDRLLAESEHKTKETMSFCDGSETIRKSRSMSLFLDETPGRIGQFASLVDGCRQ